MGFFFFFFKSLHMGFYQLLSAPCSFLTPSLCQAGGWGGGRGKARYYILSTRTHSEGKRTNQPQCMRWMETIQPAHPNYIIFKKKKGGGRRKKNLLTPLPPSLSSKRAS